MENFKTSRHVYGEKIVSYYTSDIIEYVVEALAHAKISVKANIAYLSNEYILDVLPTLARKGILVEVIISNTNNNNKNYSIYNHFLNIENINIFEYGSDDWKSGIMHRKSIVIDNKIVLAGSYNWTYQADKNIEELLIIEDLHIAEQIAHEFNSLKQVSKALKYSITKLGRTIPCTKNEVKEIEIWWASLDSSWQNIFNNNFRIGLNPKLDELISILETTHFSLKEYDNIKEILPITTLQNLRHLAMYKCSKIVDFTPLKSLKKIEYLDLAHTSISDLSPLTGLNNLKELYISFTNVTDLTPILGLKLSKLWMIGLDFKIPRKQILKFRRENPNCFTPTCIEDIFNDTTS